MTLFNEALSAHGRVAPGPGERARAFASATRHTRLVRFLRKAIMIGSVAGMAGIVAVTLFDPFGRLPKDLSVGNVRVNGTRVTLELPKLSGYRQDGRPYDVRAASGVQDLRKPNIVELTDIEARFETTEQATVRLASPRGVYDSSKEFMKLLGDVHVMSDKGFDVRMRDADIDFRAGSVVSVEPVSVVSQSGTITADRVTITENGKKITFEGRVRSAFRTGVGAGLRGAGQ